MHGVIVGCRDDAGRWLLIRRSANVAAPLKVCFPGGAVEVGETPEQAAVREIREELGLHVADIERVWDHTFPEHPLRLFGFLARSYSGQLTPDRHEVSEILWLTADEAGSHPDAMPRTQDFVTALECAAASGHR
ncbi:MAG: 8-oxo-dGTP diphosphatase MutT [Phycisphaeraceae bacterium]